MGTLKDMFGPDKKPLKKKKQDQPKEVTEDLEVETPKADTKKFNDLREVMDYNRKLSIMFSGVENESYLDILYNMGVRNFLMSYEYLKGKGNKQLKKYPDMHLFIDSGAYTYMNDPKYEQYTVEQWEKQIVNYLNWARKHKDSIFAMCDLDLQYLVGDKVYEWRKKYFEPFMLETGIPVCFMYHDEGLEQWEYMCKRYPYVGLSLAIDNKENGYNELIAMFKIAEKHNALCQGMASTNTKMLTQFPFYTVDSTTWNVGLKYGEISVWNGSKMSRIKKEDFQSKAFPLISRYDYQFDFNAILEEDKTELIKVNAYAFIQAEKYVNERLKAKMYWLKARTTKVDLDNLPEDFYPPLEWFDNPTNPEEYAKKLNINPQYDEVIGLINDVVAFLNWDNPEYKEMREFYEESPDIVDRMHDNLVNRIVSTFEEKVSDIQAFFKECVSGNNDRLLQMGTNFDRVARERESYIEEDLDEIVDVSLEEVQASLATALPSGAPEIDSLDDEIFKDTGIVPVRDASGKFLKGQKKVRKPKNIYSEKYPKLMCSTCFASQTCPEYKEGYVCAYNKMFKRFDCRNPNDILDAMQSMVNMNMERMQRAAIFEMMNGGITDGAVTGFINQNMNLLLTMQKMYDNDNGAIMRHTKTVSADGTVQETTTVKQSTGILEKMFMNSNSTPEEDTGEDLNDIVDVTPTE